MNYNTKYVVRLTADERETLLRLVNKGKVAAEKRRRAQILLQADAGADGSGRTDGELAAGLAVGTATVHRVRQAYVERGLEAALERKPSRQVRWRKLSGEGEARLIATACGPAPEGRGRWTLRLLAERLVELQVVESICRETVRQTLKKTLSNPG